MTLLRAGYAERSMSGRLSPPGSIAPQYPARSRKGQGAPAPRPATKKDAGLSGASPSRTWEIWVETCTESRKDPEKISVQDIFPPYPERAHRCPPPSCPDLFRASTSRGIAVRAGRGRGGGRTWMPGTSPLLSGLTSGRALCRQARPSPPPVVTPDLIRGPGKPGDGGACGSGPRIKSGVTTGGQGRRGTAGRDPCPDPAEGPETRLYQRLVPAPPHLNRTAVEQVQE